MSTSTDGRTVVTKIPLNEFNSASDYREFSRRYVFNPAARLKITGERTLAEAIPRAAAKGHGQRYDIFSQVLKTGRTVREINEHAQRIAPDAEPDADIFIALLKGYAVLEP